MTDGITLRQGDLSVLLLLVWMEFFLCL